MTSKRRTTTVGGGGSVAATLETLPESIINEILQKLDLESLCSSACVSRTLHSSASQVLASLSSLDLSAFSPDDRTLDGIFGKLKGVKSVTLDCLRLNDSSVSNLLGPNILELNLLKGSSLSYDVLLLIGQRCPNIRNLLVELVWQEAPINNIEEWFRGLKYLESLAVKIRGTEVHEFGSLGIEHFLPETLRNLKLQPVYERDFVHFVRKLKDDEKARESLTNVCIPMHLGHRLFGLQRLSLVLDYISDKIVITIVDALPLLSELDLEDKPYIEPIVPHDLTNYGLQALGSCQHLAALSIVRSRQNYPASFKRINDLGLFLLSEGCQGLKSVTLGGFSTVTDAGFSSIFRSCQDLKKFEIRNASLLSDLAFHDMSSATCSLVELRIISCGLITSEAVPQLATSRSLEVLDVSGCRSIADTCLSYISALQTLTTLNLSGAADVTDKGLAILGNADLPITHLSFRGCKRISDKGIARLLRDGGRIRKTLSSLDVGHMPGISDTAISTIASVAQAVTELCIRYCFFVTDAALETLTSERRHLDGNRILQKLDLFNCVKLSNEMTTLLQSHKFHGLKWLGVGLTFLESKRNDFSVICHERPWLTVCFDGCEMGCHDGWQFHRSYDS